MSAALDARAVEDLVGRETAALRAADKKRHAPLAPIAVLKAMLGDARLRRILDIAGSNLATKEAWGAGVMKPCTTLRIAAAERTTTLVSNFMAGFLFHF
jgi:hypothetical protein